MKKYLLDTRTIFWFLTGNKKLSEKVKDIIEKNPDAIIVSIVSIWKIAIKISIRKLKLKQSLENLTKELIKSNILSNNLFTKTVLHVQALLFHHRGPFDYSTSNN